MLWCGMVQRFCKQRAKSGCPLAQQRAVAR
jgi:hypothetical protein